MGNQIDLNGRVAVVTGGAQGIGQTIAERLLASGAAVAVWDRDLELGSRCCKGLSVRGRIIPVKCDIRASLRRSRRGTLRLRPLGASICSLTMRVSRVPICPPGNIQPTPGTKSSKRTRTALSTAPALLFLR